MRYILVGIPKKLLKFEEMAIRTFETVEQAKKYVSSHLDIFMKSKINNVGVGRVNHYNFSKYSLVALHTFEIVGEFDFQGVYTKKEQVKVKYKHTSI